MSDTAPSEKKPKNAYKATLNLPKTAFPMKANLVQNAPATLKRWAQAALSAQTREARAEGERFVFHDGPPYANGSIHMGHLMNKCLKDFVVRSQGMLGRDCPVVPGWDCHGLPIELKVLQKLKSSERRELTPLKLRQRAKAFALETVEKQSEGFQRYGVWGDWAHPYMTLQPEYEAAQLGVFG